jgi:xkdN-like protein
VGGFFFFQFQNRRILTMSLSAFLAENALSVENVKFVASKRFLSDELDDKGKRKPMEWEIKAITGTEDEALRKSCAKRFPVPGKKNQYQKETDYDMYLGKLAVACTAFPNLNDKDLQDSYKVMGAEALLKTMLTPGEYADYLTKVQEVCGFETTLQDEVDEAKN